MYPIVRRTAFNFSVPRNFAISNRSHRILLMALWILSILFLLMAAGGRAQTITFNGLQTTILRAAGDGPRAAVNRAGILTSRPKQ
jgi:hypothetical protein